MNTYKPTSSEAQARTSHVLRESGLVPRMAASGEVHDTSTDSLFHAVWDVQAQPSVIARQADGALVAVNQAFLRVTGLDREQVLGRTLCELGSAQRAISSTRFEHGAEVYLLHVLRTMPERAWLDRLPVAIWITHDRDARQILRNRAALTLSRMRDDDAPVRFQVYTGNAPQLAREQPLQQAARTGRALRCFDQELRFDTGERVFLRGSASPLLDDLGNPCGAIAAAIDVTALKHTEGALRDADRRKDDFLAMLSHELRNPLAPILTALQLMQQRSDAQSAHEREVIARQLQHLTRMVDDLLDVSRITRGKLMLNQELTELAPIVARALEATAPLFERRRHQLRVNVPEQGLLVQGDELRLTQIFSNLLTNAARYTPLGGRIDVTVQREQQEVVARVRDNGEGIDPRLMGSIFELFVQGERAPDRAAGGLGLGLALVRALARLHGGTVEARSAGAGQGSEFVVRLPLAEEPTLRISEVRATTPARYIAQHRRRVLVVDDNEDAADMLCALLTAAGHELQVASDPLEALALAEHFKPEVALLDIGLPVMDGYTLGCSLCERLAPAERPVLIALTGYGQEHDRKRSQGAGFAHHLVKPVNTHALLRLLDALPTP